MAELFTLLLIYMFLYRPTTFFYRHIRADVQSDPPDVSVKIIQRLNNMIFKQFIIIIIYLIRGILIY